MIAAPALGVTAALVGARLRAARRRWLPTIVALGLGVMLPVVSRAAGSVTADGALRRGLAALATRDRIVTVATYQEPGEVLPDDLDATARAGLARLGRLAPVHVLTFRPLADRHGGTFQLAAADELARSVRVVTGRLPQRCGPDLCEVVELADRQPVGELDPSLGVVAVGTVARTQPLLLGGSFEADPDAAVLIADGTARLNQLHALTAFGRSQGWMSEVDLAHLRSVGVDRWVATARSVADQLIAKPWNLGLTAPDRLLAAEVARARRSAQRFLLLGSAMGVLLLGASVVAGTAMRRDHSEFVGVLRRRGVSRERIGAVTGAETLGVVFAGTTLGLALGAAVAVVLGHRAGLDAWDVALDAVCGALGAAALFGAASVGLIVATLLLPDDSAGRRDAWRLVDAGLLLAVFALVLVARRTHPTGSADDRVLSLLPALSLVAGGLLAGRLWPTMMRLVDRAIPRRAVTARLGVIGASGRPLRPVATAALITTAVGATVFAVAYRQTLERGAADQAADAVPIDAKVTTGPTLARALDLVTPDEVAQLGDGSMWPVLRLAASVRTTATDSELVQLVGVDPPMLAHVRRWGATVGVSDGASVARDLDVAVSAGGPTLPVGHTLTIDVTGPAVRLAVTATVRTPDGRVRAIPLRVEPEGGRDGPQQLVGDVPALAGADRVELAALTAAEASDVTTRRQHNLGEGHSDRESASVTIEIGEVHVDGAPVADPWRGWNGLVPVGNEAGNEGSAGRQRWDFVLSASRSAIASRPQGPGDAATPVPVAVDRKTAALAGGVGGTLTIVLDRVPVVARVARVLPQFPSVDGRFAVLERAALERLVDVIAPGTGQPGELWVELASGRARLSGALYERLTVTNRVDVAEHLRSDPVARSASRILLAVAALTMLMAIVVLTLFVVTERHDDTAQLLTWETEGVTPSRLRRALVWRTLAIELPALPFGVASGLMLSRLTARLIAVTAAATIAKPPLVPGTGAWLGVGAALVCLAAGGAVVGAIAMRSFTEAVPPRITAGVA